MPRMDNQDEVEEESDDVREGDQDDEGGGEEQADGEENDDDDDDDDSDEMNPMTRLPEYAVKRVEKLQELDASRESIMEKYLAERSELEKRFADLLKPLYEERGSVVKGEKDEEIAKATGSEPPQPPSLSEDGVAGGGGGGEEQEVLTGVPHFWVTAISNHECIGELITEEDVDCLEHLQDITCVDKEDGKGFEVLFNFAPNDYFTNTILTKSYTVPNLLLSDEPMLKQVQGCVIHWKNDERCLTHRRYQKKQRGKGKKAGQIRTITKTEKKESFFQWFEAPKMPTNIENMDEEEVDEIEEQFTDDFEIAQAFRGEICPRAVLWYTGEVRVYECLQVVCRLSVVPGCILMLVARPKKNVRRRNEKCWK